jgi:preprotein translocase subunit SecG
MSFQAVVKTVMFLALLFVMLYIGMNNTHQIDFQFPIAGVTAKNPIRQPAAILYFGVFAVGVFAGMLLHTGKGGGKKASSSKDK